jgi:hypothetical protein
MKNILTLALIVITVYFILFTFIGIMEGSKNREFNISKGCIYKSYLSLYNPAFRFGCMIVRDRSN